MYSDLSFYILSCNVSVKYVAERGEKMKNLVEPIKVKKDVEAVEQYLAKHSLRNQLIWVFGVNTGLRISDILGLDVEQVRNKDTIDLIEKKTGKSKKIRLNNKLQKMIKQYLVERDKNYCITGEEPLFIGKKHHRLDRSQVYRFINEACRELNININAGCHSMRKVFGWFFYKKYNDIALLQSIFNHSSPEVTLRYIGITQEEINTSYKNFEL